MNRNQGLIATALAGALAFYERMRPDARQREDAHRRC